ncbi:MAG: MBL fold metallo-hydrolase [Myxococcota bacterium]
MKWFSWRRIVRWLRASAILLGLALLFAIGDGWRAFGQRAQGARLERIRQSPQFRDGRFHNPEPLVNDMWGAFLGVFHRSHETSPEQALPVKNLAKRAFDSPPRAGVRVTWFGHSSILVEIDGARVLTDPVWSERASPFSWVGPRRWYPSPLALEDLPKLDAVVISHDHYDHLDYASVVALNRRQVRFVVPLGIGAHLAYWGVPEERIVELDWWQSTRQGSLEIVCTPARHASGRTGFFDQDASLWASFAFVGPQHRVYFSGDTGLFKGMRSIGERLGPFDLTMIETGQYHRTWPDWHIGPEQALLAHEWLRGRVMLPIHWGKFALAYHAWTEPAERAVAAATQAHAVLLLPRPGEPMELVDAGHVKPWWPKLAWQNAREHPIVSTQVE